MGEVYEVLKFFGIAKEVNKTEKLTLETESSFSQRAQSQGKLQGCIIYVSDGYPIDICLIGCLLLLDSAYGCLANEGPEK